jgi:hypothetical protein
MIDDRDGVPLRHYLTHHADAVAAFRSGAQRLARSSPPTPLNICEKILRDAKHYIENIARRLQLIRTL